MLNQRLQQRLVQKLSPQQVLVMRLLQEPLLALEQRIKQEIEENPALELEEDSLEEEERETTEDAPIEDSIDSDEDEFSKDVEEESPSPESEIDIDEYYEDDEIPDYKLNANNKSPDDEVHERPLVSDTSYQDYLLGQLGLIKHTDKQHIIAITIIGNIDESGYLQRDVEALVNDLAFNQNVDATEQEIEEVLKMIQQFDPPGIGARDLRECLILQLERKPSTFPEIKLSLEIVKEHFIDFTKRHFDKILVKTKAAEPELKKAIDEIQKLNPKPGSSISEVSRINHYVIPDFIVTNHDDELELSLNNYNMPDLGISKMYQDMLREYSAVAKKKSAQGKSTSNSEKAAVTFIRQKIESAKGFIDAIKQRQDTLFLTMQAIMEYQKEYFLTGDETRLRPMILKDIATIVNLDISTVSRVANSKYVQTPFGTLLLKSFFSESMQNTKGEEISTREIKKILQDCIEAEDKNDPLTDEQLVDLLNEKGYNIARRTIAKYREQLNIPVARLRREL
jgi:RNA polymerase sigma-54 factor